MPFPSGDRHCGPAMQRRVYPRVHGHRQQTHNPVGRSVIHHVVGVSPCGDAPIRAHGEAPSAVGGQSDHRFTCQPSARLCRHRHGAVGIEPAVTKLIHTIVAPGIHAGFCPNEHEIVAVAAVVICYEVIFSPGITQGHRLAVGEIVECPANEGKSCIIYYHQRGAHRRRVVQRQVDQVPRCGKRPHRQRHLGSVGVTRRQCPADTSHLNCERIGITARRVAGNAHVCGAHASGGGRGRDLKRGSTSTRRNR